MGTLCILKITFVVTKDKISLNKGSRYFLFMGYCQLFKNFIC